jgi:transcription elongation factor Elf1
MTENSPHNRLIFVGGSCPECSHNRFISTAEDNALGSETMVVCEQCKDVCSAEEAGLNAPAN